MIRHRLHFHLGFDHHGHRHVKLRGPAEIRRARERRLLHPVVILIPCGGSQDLIRNKRFGLGFAR